MNATPEAYQSLLMALLPQGAAWPRDPDTTLSRVLLALADGLARAQARTDNLVIEADPRMTLELLPDWERAFGLPDPCAGAGTLQERRAWLVLRMTMIGGQSRAFFIGLAALLGYTITIREHQPFQAGRSHAGDPCENEPWRFVWEVHETHVAEWFFRAGQSAAGDPLVDRPTGILECLFTRLKPAHTNVIFTYGS